MIPWCPKQQTNKLIKSSRPQTLEGIQPYKNIKNCTLMMRNFCSFWRKMALKNLFALLGYCNFFMLPCKRVAKRLQTTGKHNEVTWIWKIFFKGTTGSSCLVGISLVQISIRFFKIFQKYLAYAFLHLRREPSVYTLNQNGEFPFETIVFWGLLWYFITCHKHKKFA